MNCFSKSTQSKKNLAVAIVVMFAVCGTAAGVGAAPCLELRKEGPYIAHPGEVISFTLTAKNCGDVYLGSSVGIYDPPVWDPNTTYPVGSYPQASGLVWANDLEAGETASTVVNYLVTTNDCGQLVNDAWVQSPYSGGYTTDYPYAFASASWTVTVECTQPGTGTPGYWKNHREAWPVEEITVGGVTYSKADAIAYLSSAVVKDKTVTMFKGLVSAMLNVLVGNDSSCISGAIATADAWMVAHPVGSMVKASSPAWRAGEPVSTNLDNYNNGMLCAPHRD